MKFNLDRGLGKFSQGRKDPIKAIRVPHKTGLGFKPSLKHQIKWSRKKKWAGLKASRRSVSISKLPTSPPRTCITLPNEPQTLVFPSTPLVISTESVQPVIIPSPKINHFPIYQLEAVLTSLPLVKLFQHLPYFNSKPSVPKVGESSDTPTP